MHYFHDMAAIYGSADLLITRSGAVTCAELESLGKFAILIPLPHGNGEQIDNAQALVRDGAAVMVMNSEFDRNWLVANIGSALEKSRAFQPRKLGVNSGAALRIAELSLLELDKSKTHEGEDK
jgi:UDP-N-acetylglucosamine--N-acetylmuramyl-(pentapeptide) pyrophosphoryl-undecaprenol N-acetylglucosamine transferase